MVHRISDVEAWEALDSRGNPTVAVRVSAESGFAGRALAPSGASAGSHEALFLRDGGEAYGGKSVRQVTKRGLPLIREAWIGKDLADQAGLEHALRDIDSSPNWSVLGGNLSTAASVAAWLALSDAQRRAPWELIAEWTGSRPSLPVPMINIVSGGAHAAEAVAIQDVLVIPKSAQSFEDAIERVWQIRSGTSTVMRDLGFETALVADEGGLAAAFGNSEAAIAAVVSGISSCGLKPGVDATVALDIAANEFRGEGGTYDFEGANLSESDLGHLVHDWINRWPISSVEDPLGEDANWSYLAPLVSSIQVVGDDRYATSVARLLRGIEKNEANCVLIKPNQAGTLWEALRALREAKTAGWGTIVSARSGDTEEQWLVDLAVGSGAGQIKVGSTMRSERTSKWNRLLELSATEKIPYAQENDGGNG